MTIKKELKEEKLHIDDSETVDGDLALALPEEEPEDGKGILPNETFDTASEDKEKTSAHQQDLGRLGLILELAAQKVVLVLLGCTMLYLSLYAFKYSHRFKSYADEYLENHFDGKMGHILWILAAVLILCGIKVLLVDLDKSSHENKGAGREAFFRYLVFFYFFTSAVLWVKISHSLPYGDQANIVQAAMSFQNGNFEDLHAANYMGMFPHQLSLVFLVECIYKLFGNGQYYLYQYLNACFLLLLVWSGYKVATLLFPKKQVGTYYLLLMIGMVPLTFYVPYIYGDMGSMAFMMLGCYGLLSFLREQKKLSLIIAVLASITAAMLHKNALIFILAEICVLVVATLKHKKINYMALAGIILVGYLFGGLMVEKIYEYRLGEPLSKGVPSVAFIAMGIQDGWPGPGWYNNYIREVYQNNHSDSAMAAAEAKENLKERLLAFSQNKPAGVEFLKQKVLTQWNEPTFEAFWANHSFTEELREGTTLYSIFESGIHDRLWRFMNHYQVLIYGLFTLAMAMLFVRQRPIEQLLPAIFILGGFFFTILWEAKSRYVLQYFVFMVIYAAYSLANLEEKARMVLKNNRRS